MKYFLLISSVILWKILQEETAASFDCHHLWLPALFNCISRVSSLNLDLTKSGNLKRFASSSPQVFICNWNRVVKEFRIWISAVLWPRALRARLSTFSFQMRHSFEGGVYSGVALIRENMTRVSWHACHDTLSRECHKFEDMCIFNEWNWDRHGNFCLAVCFMIRSTCKMTRVWYTLL